MARRAHICYDARSSGGTHSLGTLTMKRSLQIGVLLLNAFVLALEIGLTRIFSVTMFYHFAFMAIGVALFGFGAAGVFLYIARKRFEGRSLAGQLGMLSILAGITAVLALLIALSINFNPQGALSRQFLKLVIIYLANAVPFLFAGLAMPLVFQRLSGNISRLYLLSLVGSALGALIIVPVLQFGGGPGAILVVAGIAFLAAWSFYLAEPADATDSAGARTSKPSRIGITTAIILGLALIAIGFLNPAIHFVRVTHAKGYEIPLEKIIYDRWNAFSRIIVLRGQNPLDYYQGGIHNWGISENWGEARNPFPEQLWLEIDNTAGTPITHYTGDPQEIEIARYDVTAAAHYLLNQPSVLVVGPGGGKDLLAAIAFGASKIDGAEINPLIGEVMRHKFADFDGDLYDRPPVHVTVSEGRTFIARSREKYDLIQISLIDTWAAASTGAYALSENNLYTVEAFEEYLKHLSPDGIFSMSRFEFEPPRETLKVVALAREALRRMGIDDPSRSIMVIKQGYIANVMIRPAGFDEAAIDNMSHIVLTLAYGTLYMPGQQLEGTGDNSWFYNELPNAPDAQKLLASHPSAWYYHELITTDNPDRFIATYPLDIRPTSDDRPFFFYLLPPWQFMKALEFGKSYQAGYNSIAVFTLVSLLLISIVVVFLFIVLPLLLFNRKDIRERSGPKLRLLGYFIGLGLAYMLIEIALMQHFTLFLGYPIYSLVAVLMSLLLFSGLGSGWTGRVKTDGLEKGIGGAVLGIGIVAIIYILALPPIFSAMIVLPDWLRIVIAVILVFPLGWFMGQPFPLGLRLVEREGLGIIPWAWGVNGAASVLGSALALALAIGIGYRLTLFVGIAVYLVAWGLTGIAGRFKATQQSAEVTHT